MILNCYIFNDIYSNVELSNILAVGCLLFIASYLMKNKKSFSSQGDFM